MDLIPRRRRADLIRPQQWQGRKRPRELTFSWLQLIIRCVFSFFPAGGRGRKKDWGRERETEILRKGLDRWLLASTRARLTSKMGWWRGRIKEERGPRNGEGQAASRYESSFPTFKSNLRTSNPPRMEVLTGGHLCVLATKSIRTDGREL